MIATQTLVVSWSDRHPSSELVDVVRETAKAYQLRNQETGRMAWIPKSGLRPYTPPASMPREVDANELVVADWFRRCCDRNQMAALGFAE